MEDDQLILSVAITNHQIWMSNLKAYVNGKSALSDIEVSSPTNCCLGKWMNCYESDKFKQYPEFIELLDLHKKLHYLGADIVKSKQQGDQATIENLLKELEPISKEIILSIERLKTKISSI